MFEWDDRNIAHIARHRVTPREAEEAMVDPRRTRAAAYDVAGERRYAITGRTTRGRLITVVYTYAGEGRNQRFRVITARPPHDAERAKYEGS